MLLKDEIITQLHEQVEELKQSHQRALLNTTGTKEFIIKELQETIAMQRTTINELEKEVAMLKDSNELRVSQLETLQVSYTKLESQYTNEVNTNQERKAKVKALLDTLANEKHSLEFQIQSKDQLIKANVEEMLLVQQRNQSLQLQMQQEKQQQINEIQRKEEIIENYKQQQMESEAAHDLAMRKLELQYVEEISSYKAKYQEMKLELDELTNKRVTARNEIIKMAQVFIVTFKTWFVY